VSNNSWRIVFQATNARKLKVWQKDRGDNWHVIKPDTLLTGAGSYRARVTTRHKLSQRVSDNPARLQIKVWWPTRGNNHLPHLDQTSTYYTNIGSGSKSGSWNDARLQAYSRGSATSSDSNASTSTDTVDQTQIPVIAIMAKIDPGTGRSPNGSGTIKNVVVVKTNPGLSLTETGSSETVDVPPQEDTFVGEAEGDAETLAADVDEVTEEALDELPENSSIEVLDEENILPPPDETAVTDQTAMSSLETTDQGANIAYMGGGALVGVLGATMVGGDKVGGSLLGVAAGYLLKSMMKQDE